MASTASGSLTPSPTAPATILGGVRHYTIDLEGAAGDTASLLARPSVGDLDGALDFSANAGTSARWTVTYNGNAGDPLAGDLGLDLSGALGLSIEARADQSGVPIEIFLNSFSGGFLVDQTSAVTVIPELPVGSYGTLFFSVADFLLTNPGFDLTNIGSVDIVINVTDGLTGFEVDGNLDNFQVVVPEPSSMFVLGSVLCGAGGLLIGRRRKCPQ